MIWKLNKFAFFIKSFENLNQSIHSQRTLNPKPKNIYITHQTDIFHQTNLEVLEFREKIMNRKKFS